MTDYEGGNIIRTHVKLMSYMTFQLTFYLMKWNFVVTHMNLTTMWWGAIHNDNYYLQSPILIFFLVVDGANTMKNNTGASADCWKSISSLSSVCVMKGVVSGERFKTIDLYNTSDILSGHITIYPEATIRWNPVFFSFVENLVARELLTI